MKKELERIANLIEGKTYSFSDFADEIVAKFETEKYVHIEKGSSSTPNNKYVIAYAEDENDEEAEYYLHIEIEEDYEEETIYIEYVKVCAFRY